MPTLRLYLENARDYVLDTAERYDPRAPLEARIEAFRVYSLALKMVAYARLLLESDVEGFFVNLYRVAANGLQLLRVVREEPQGTGRIPASSNDGLLAALVTAPALAGELATLSARERLPPEYEDEFLGAFFLQEAIRPRAPGEPPADLESISDRLEQAWEKETPHARALRALARRDWAGFDLAFHAWNQEAAAALDRTAEAAGAPWSLGLTRHVWLEGLAVLNLAEHQGCPLAPAVRPKIPGLLLRARPVLVGVNPLILGASRPGDEDL
ncbi:hypothetical protein [Corallococcus terminator]|uniref:Uncharacterized protein n=1 Tax=Corallococcus terminator TaxID=2316733 RepID=A0A3A8I6L9_9BACT|nr:hypothetical protein [Corallococcus terminator]RKG79059.1 hypothetical protein D7V88_29185 [Corallococcus terminator]